MSLIPALFAAAVVLCTMKMVCAQDFSTGPGGKKLSGASVPEGRPYYRVLLIPYAPFMHLPDPAGDVELAEGSGMDMEQIRKKVRLSLDMELGMKIKERYHVTPLLRQKNPESGRDLEKIYGASGYRYEERPPEIITDSGKKEAPAIHGGQRTETRLEKGQIITRELDRERQYLNVVLSDKSLLHYLAGKYESDLFLFINQMEIHKAFAGPSDAAYGQYRRVIKVHYTVTDKEGVQVGGDVIVAALAEKTDDIERIIHENFPLIAEKLASSLPGQGKTAAEEKLEKEQRKKAAEQDLVRPH